MVGQGSILIVHGFAGLSSATLKTALPQKQKGASLQENGCSLASNRHLRIEQESIPRPAAAVAISHKTPSLAVSHAVAGCGAITPWLLSSLSPNVIIRLEARFFPNQDWRLAFGIVLGHLMDGIEITLWLFLCV